MTRTVRTRTDASADSVSTRLIPVTPTSGSVAAVVTDSALVTPTAGAQTRLLKFHLHMDPAAADGVYNTVTLKLGSVTFFEDKFEAGLPYAEAITIEGGVDDVLTITTTNAARIFYNLRTEEF